MCLKPKNTPYHSRRVYKKYKKGEYDEKYKKYQRELFCKELVGHNFFIV